jgi:hypothetical protein
MHNSRQTHSGMVPAEYRTRIARRLQRLLFSSRPQWAHMPSGVATNFVENLLFLLSALEFHGIRYTAHYGTLLGACRLGGVLPWDEDADIYIIGEHIDDAERKLRATLEAHGFELIRDPRGFFWVRQHPWWAGQGHIGLSLLSLAVPGQGTPLGGFEDQRMSPGEALPLARLPFYSTWIWGPAEPERLIHRLYGETGSESTMTRFRAPRVAPETLGFWQRAREQSLDWDAVCARMRERRKHRPWSHVITFPWWWFNGAYNIGIQRLRALGRSMAAREE